VRSYEDWEVQRSVVNLLSGIWYRFNGKKYGSDNVENINTEV